MNKLGAAMAGEMSGHLFFIDRYSGYNAIYAACRLIEIHKKHKLQKGAGAASITLPVDLPKTFTTPEI